MRDFARKNMVKTVCKLTKSVRKAMRAIQMMYFFGVIGYNSPDPSRLRARSARVCLRQTQKRAGVSDHLPNTLLPQFRSSKIAADVIYHPSKFRNRLPFELQCWATTHFKGFDELSSLPLYLERFGGGKVF